MFGRQPLMLRHRVLVVLAVGAVDFAFQQAITPALPEIQVRLDASPTSVTWLITGFLLATVVALPLAGPLGDRYGRRRMLLWSLAAFASARSSAPSRMTSAS